MIVWLASYPRSGNTLVRELLWNVFGVPSFSIYEEKRAPLGKLLRQLNAPSLKSLQERPELIFMKTHEMPERDDYPALLIVRDGRDTLVSYAHFSAKESGVDDTNVDEFTHRLERLIAEKNHFGGWGEHAEAWLTRSPTPVILKYESVLQRKEAEVSDALESLREQIGEHNPWVVPMGPDRLGWGMRRGLNTPDFDTLSERNPKMFRRGEPGAFRDEMPADLAETFWRKYGKVMERLGYEK